MWAYTLLLILTPGDIDIQDLPWDSYGVLWSQVNKNVTRYEYRVSVIS